uniref:Photosystem I P700 apoprotein A1 n=1 Tax=Steinernema glaseri TaxID=37863 RepID=A0A1I7YGW0_9BILA
MIDSLPSNITHGPFDRSARDS